MRGIDVSPASRTLKRAHYSTISSDINCVILAECYATAPAKFRSEACRASESLGTTRQALNLNPVIHCGSSHPHPAQAFANFQPAIARKRSPQAWTIFPHVDGIARLAFYTVPQPTFLLTRFHVFPISNLIISDHGGYVASKFIFAMKPNVSLPLN